MINEILTRWTERWSETLSEIKDWFGDYTGFVIELVPERDLEGGGAEWRGNLTVQHSWGIGEPIEFFYPVRMSDDGCCEFDTHDGCWAELSRQELWEIMFLDLASRYHAAR